MRGAAIMSAREIRKAKNPHLMNLVRILVGVAGLVAGSLPIASTDAMRQASAQAPTSLAAPPPNRQLTLYNWEGDVVGNVAQPGVYAQPSFSPDGARIAVIHRGDVWVFNVATGSGLQITATPDPENGPIWS